MIDERVKGIADVLDNMHYDGKGCGTNGITGCLHCFGPSPMTTYEIVEFVARELDHDFKALEDDYHDVLDNIEEAVERVDGKHKHQLAPSPTAKQIRRLREAPTPPYLRLEPGEIAVWRDSGLT